jgi:hypothetical protein
MSRTQRAAALQVAAWSQAGLHTSNLKVSFGSDAATATFVHCSGDVCKRMSLRHTSDMTAAPSPRLLVRLLTQPAAVAAISGLGFLAYCCFVDAAFTTAVLESTLGSRATAWLVLYAAVLAHAGEGAYACLACARAPLGLSAGACAGWGITTFVVGFPVLRWVLALKKSALKAAGAE